MLQPNLSFTLQVSYVEQKFGIDRRTFVVWVKRTYCIEYHTMVVV